MSISHIIFDCDGVLIDSEEISMRVDRLLLAESGVAISGAEMHRRFVGKTFAGMVAEIESERGIRLPADLEARKDDRMLEIYRSELAAVQGIAAALAELDVPLSIATNGPRHRALEALKITGLDHHFGGRLTTFEDVTHAKPAPDIYLLAAERAGVSPRHCLVIEDSVTGVTSAVGAGCPTLGFTGSHLHRDDHGERLLEIGALKVFADMRELPEIVRALT